MCFRAKNIYVVWFSKKYHNIDYAKIQTEDHQNSPRAASDQLLCSIRKFLEVKTNIKWPLVRTTKDPQDLNRLR